MRKPFQTFFEALQVILLIIFEVVLNMSGDISPAFAPF
jgi:hypothetical protein